MQISQLTNGFRPLNDQPVFRPPSTQRLPIPSTGSPIIDVRPIGPTVLQVPSTLVQTSFGNLLQSTGVTLPPTPTPDHGRFLGPPVHADNLAPQIRDYKSTLSTAHADLVTQLQSARETLKAARQSRDQDAISSAQTALDNINVQLQANHDSFSQLHHDATDLRELRQHLIADVKARNLDALQQDRDAITQQRAQVLADIQA